MNLIFEKFKFEIRNILEFKTRHFIVNKVIIEKSRGGRFLWNIEIWAGFGPDSQFSCLHSFKIC